MRIAVLGCGPAGLMAAHGAMIAGAKDVRIFSKKRKSEMFGAQYLHAPIPGATSTAPVNVHYLLRGTPYEYRYKVYGDRWDGTVSPEDLETDHEAWDIRDTYNNLWDKYGDYVYGTALSAGFVDNMLVVGDFDLIISSVPKHVLCHKKDEHSFGSTRVWAIGDAPERGIFAPFRNVPDNTVICNGDKTPAWYRVSKLFGYVTCEWPDAVAPPPFEGITDVIKPTHNNCDCWPEVIHVGRYGKWEKGVLSHTAYFDVVDRLVTEPVT